MVDYNEKPFKWAIGAQQKNSNVDHFLSDLHIQEWDVKGFVQLLEEKVSEPSRVPGNNSKHKKITDKEFMTWFAKKSDDWHQELYAFLSSEFLTGQDYKQRQAIERLRPLKIVRISDGSYRTGIKCFFPSDSIKHDVLMPRVAMGVFSSGKSKVDQEAAMRFLSSIGVRKVGEAEQVEEILKSRYADEFFNPDINDLKRFILLVEKEPQQAKLFADYYIFECTDGEWRMPNDVFLDDPFITTGLSAYYAILDAHRTALSEEEEEEEGDYANRTALSPSYLECGVSVEKIAKFAKEVGANACLEIEDAFCDSNPDAQRLVWEASGYWTDNGTDEDYTITGLEYIIDKEDKALSSIVWRTLCMDVNTDWITARFRNNTRHEIRSAPSQLICILRDAKWVPQNDGCFVRPCEASPEMLPEGFPFDLGQKWLNAVHFGEEVVQRSEEQSKKQAVAKELGFPDQKSLEDAKWFAGLAVEERQQFKAEYQSRLEHDFADPPVNPGRIERVAEQARDALEKQTGKRSRSITLGLDEVKEEAYQYLLHYKKGDNPMICQVCNNSLPFKLDDGNDYFEMVEFLPELKKRHYQNYLALCPNHAAMFRFANRSRDTLKDKFLEIESNNLKVILAQKEKTIYFSKKHIADLKTVIKVDQQEDEYEEQT